MTTNETGIIDKLRGIDPAVKYYWKYQYRLGSEIIVPAMIETGAFKPGQSVCEIGCAEGGALGAFVTAGAVSSFGTDVALSRLDSARLIAEKLNLDIEYYSHDIVTTPPEVARREKADLVILRDVIEHLDDPRAALENIKLILKPGGRLYVTFPPYHSAYGGHQHTLANLAGKAPYVHLLPRFLFKLALLGGRPADVEETMRLRELRLTPKKFLEAATESGLAVEREDYYLIRPVYKFKFGLPAVSLNAIKKLPLVKSFLAMEASYLLKKQV